MVFNPETPRPGGYEGIYKGGRIMFAVRDREAGNIIGVFNTYSAASLAISLYELEDKMNGCYEPEFYEIWEVPERV